VLSEQLKANSEMLKELFLSLAITLPGLDL
jgi:hypothetical protein